MALRVLLNHLAVDTIAEDRDLARRWTRRLEPRHKRARVLAAGRRSDKLPKRHAEAIRPVEMPSPPIDVHRKRHVRALAKIFSRKPCAALAILELAVHEQKRNIRAEFRDELCRRRTVHLGPGALDAHRTHCPLRPFRSHQPREIRPCAVPNRRKLHGRKLVISAFLGQIVHHFRDLRFFRRAQLLHRVEAGDHEDDADIRRRKRVTEVRVRENRLLQHIVRTENYPLQFATLFRHPEKRARGRLPLLDTRHFNTPLVDRIKRTNVVGRKSRLHKRAPGGTDRQGKQNEKHRRQVFHLSKAAMPSFGTVPSHGEVCESQRTDSKRFVVDSN